MSDDTQKTCKAMDKKNEVRDYLKNNHAGEDKAVFSSELEQLFSLDGRSIRRIISELRKEGCPICSDQKGYYFAKTQQDINKTVSRLNELVTGVSNSRTGLLFARVPQGQPQIEITIRIGGETV
ncbi:MAG: hypothetical protein IJL53_04350 [Firmicutes bacterium]|nr:hypothetical protein [Bacillota bacterium]